MIQQAVAKTMKKALLSFAQKEEKQANNIALFIHTKPTDAEPVLMPKYFYAVDNQPVQEDGKLKELDFVQDILGKKMDLLGTETMASQFLAMYFKNASEETKADPKSLYIMITSSDEKAENLILALYKGSEVIKNLELEDIFGE